MRKYKEVSDYYNNYIYMCNYYIHYISIGTMHGARGTCPLCQHFAIKYVYSIHVCHE